MGKKRQRGFKNTPWYRAGRDTWHITTKDRNTGESKTITLVDANGLPIRGKGNRLAAELAWHEVMKINLAPVNRADNELRTVLEIYLRDAEKRNVNPKSITMYTTFFKSFLSLYPGLLIRDVKPKLIEMWWESSHPKWNASTRYLSGSVFKAALRFAAAGGGADIIDKNPLDGMKLPTMRKRSADVIVSDEDFNRLLEKVKNQNVRDVLTVLWESGTRPVNLCRATAANLSDDGNSLVFSEANTPTGATVHKVYSKTGRALLIPLTDRARAIVHRLAAAHPTGPIFRTIKGMEWEAKRLSKTVLHHAKKVGLEHRFTAYSGRHSRATALLEAGVSDVDVANILGNTPAIIHKNYSHLTGNQDRLRAILNERRNSAKGT